MEGPWLLVFRRKRGESRGKEVGRSALLAFREGVLMVFLIKSGDVGGGAARRVHGCLFFVEKRGESLGKKVERSALLTFREEGSVL